MSDEKGLDVIRPAPVMAGGQTLDPLLDPGQFEQIQRVAKAMASSPMTPEHLRIGAKLWMNRENVVLSEKQAVAGCARVVSQAIVWGMNPFLVADHSYLAPGGKLGYEGKLIAGLVNSRANLEGRLVVTYTGKGLERTATASGAFKGSKQVLTASLSVNQAVADLSYCAPCQDETVGEINPQTWAIRCVECQKDKTSKKGRPIRPNAMYRKDPDQKLAYDVSIRWARRYCPELVLGVVVDDSVERQRAEMAPVAEPAAAPVSFLAEQAIDVAPEEEEATVGAPNPMEAPASELNDEQLSKELARVSAAVDDESKEEFRDENEARLQELYEEKNRRLPPKVVGDDPDEIKADGALFASQETRDASTDPPPRKRGRPRKTAK